MHASNQRTGTDYDSNFHELSGYNPTRNTIPDNFINFHVDFMMKVTSALVVLCNVP
jgi:hypothetical protein